MLLRRLIALLVLAAAGCGTSELKLVPVSGKITLNGKPLEGADIYFEPEQAPSKDPGLSFYGKTDAEGRYTLFAPPRGFGTIVGKHRVIISKVPTQTGPELPKDEIPERYNAQTTLTCDVPAGGRSDANFDLTAP